MLPIKYRTKSYFLLGMGTLHGKRMSSSRGHSILLPDLLLNYGPNISRLSLLLSSHPCENFNWDNGQIIGIKKSLNRLSFLVSLLYNLKPLKRNFILPSSENLIKTSKITWKKYMEEGDFRKATVEIINIFPKKLLHFLEINKTLDEQSLVSVHKYFKETLGVILPTCLQNNETIICI